MSRFEQCTSTPGHRDHVVQFYGSDERLLATSVGRYLCEGLSLGNGILVIATKAHNEVFARQMELMGADPVAAIKERRLRFVDAAETLARFMTAGQPDWGLFQSVMRPIICELLAGRDCKGFRAYGEMVGLLWGAGRYSAAIRLEEFWNQLLKFSNFKLFCAYCIDIFGNEFQTAALNALLNAHSHLLPADKSGDLDSAICRSMDEILGKRSVEIRYLMETDLRGSPTAMPTAEATILWLKNNLPDASERILARARRYYQEPPQTKANLMRSAS